MMHVKLYRTVLGNTAQCTLGNISVLAEEWPRKFIRFYPALASMTQKSLLLFKTYCLAKELVLAVLLLYCYRDNSR